MKPTRRPFNSVLTELANRPEHRDQFVKPDGSLNQSELGRELGMSQAAMSRALKNPLHQPKRALIDALVRVFGISAAQARGEESLLAPPPDDGRLSSRTRNWAKRYDKLHPEQKKLIDEMIGQLETVNQRTQQAG